HQVDLADAEVVPGPPQHAHLLVVLQLDVGGRLVEVDLGEGVGHGADGVALAIHQVLAVLGDQGEVVATVPQDRHAPAQGAAVDLHRDVLALGAAEVLDPQGGTPGRAIGSGDDLDLGADDGVDAAVAAFDHPRLHAGVGRIAIGDADVAGQGDVADPR